jgi:hypothetical protein
MIAAATVRTPKQASEGGMSKSDNLVLIGLIFSFLEELLSARPAKISGIARQVRTVRQRLIRSRNSIPLC